MEKSEEYGALFALGVYVGLIIWGIYEPPPGPLENPGPYLFLLMILGYILWGIFSDIREREEVV